MGTLCEITAYPVEGRIPEESGRRTEEAMAAAFAELKRIDELLSNWKPDSELMGMNTAAAAEAAPGAPPPVVKVGEELFERVQVALRLAEETGGRFDPTVGPLVRAWGFLPSRSGGSREAAVAAARPKVGWHKVSLNATARTVQFAVSGMEIDFGGIAKGYAAQRAAQVLRQHGVTAALVNLGESSMTAIGAPCPLSGVASKTGCAWQILVRDPRDGETPVAALELRDGESLATSGTYEKTVGAGRGRRSHILDPRTGEALAGRTSVTLVMDDAEAADALTKFFFLVPAVGSAEAAKLLQNHPKASVMLMHLRGTTLVREVGGAQPERFWALSPAGQELRSHAAETH